MDEPLGPIAQLYQVYFPRLVGNLFKTYGSGPPDPEDVAHQAFAKLAERDGISDIKRLEGFVWITARNIMYREKRALRVRSDYAEEVSDSALGAYIEEVDPERIVGAKQQVELVFKTLKAMPERRRRIFLLCRVEGLTPEAAGERCGVSRSSAVRHLAVATEQLTSVLLGEDMP